MMDSSENDRQDPQDSRERRRNPWNHVFVATCAVFVFTVCLMVSAAFHPNAARLTQFFDRHGLFVLAIEVGVILGMAVVVMAFERRKTRREIAERERLLLSQIQDADEPGEAENA
jgi:Na+/melibiose symporter-like transporter